MRPTRFAALVCVSILLTALPALAGWTSLVSGFSAAASRTMPTAAVPSVTVSGRSVTLTWSETQLAGVPATGYTVSRYDTSNVLQPAGSGCSGVITALTCTQTGVAPGSWKYTVRAMLNNWTGPPSGYSSLAVVGAPTLDLSPASVATSSLPANLSGSIANFIDAETIRFRLGSTSGTELAGTVAGNATPAAVPAGGAAAVTVVLPSGTSVGSHSIYAVASPSGESASFVVTVTGPPPPPPVVTESAIASHPNKGKGWIKQNGQYVVYANVTGASPTVTADVSNITAGATAVSLSPCAEPPAGSCTVDGVVYGFKSAVQMSKTVTPEGTYTYSVSATNAGGSHTANFSVGVDNTVPSPNPLSLLLANKPGGTVGIPETGDTIVVTFSEPLAVNTVCTGWTNNGANKTTDTVNVTMTDTGTGGSAGDDEVTFGTASCGTFNLGHIAFGGKNYLTVQGGGSMSFTASGISWNVATRTMTITLGTLSGANIASGNQANLVSVLTPGAAIQDLAGNAISGTAKTDPAGRQF